LAVGPQGELFLGAAGDDRQADQVDESFLGDSLDVQVDVDRAVRHLRSSENVYLLVADRQRFQGVEVAACLSHLPLPFPPRPERVSELCQREDTSSGEAPDLLLPNAAKQGEVVLLHRLAVTPYAELADLAVIIEDQPRRLTTLLEPPGLVQHLLCLSIELRV